jgi:hypothetical protein
VRHPTPRSSMISHVEADDVPEGEDYGGDDLVVRWATDPNGRLYQISAALASSVEFPMFKPDDDDGPVVRVLLWRANRLLRRGQERGQRRRTGPPTWYLEAWRREALQLVVEEQCQSREAAERRIEEIVKRVAAGFI